MLLPKCKTCKNRHRSGPCPTDGQKESSQSTDVSPADTSGRKSPARRSAPLVGTSTSSGPITNKTPPAPLEEAPQGGYEVNREVNRESSSPLEEWPSPLEDAPVSKCGAIEPKGQSPSGEAIRKTANHRPQPVGEDTAKPAPMVDVKSLVGTPTGETLKMTQALTKEFSGESMPETRRQKSQPPRLEGNGEGPESFSGGVSSRPGPL
jgi:hypothetical protein